MAMLSRWLGLLGACWACWCLRVSSGPRLSRWDQAGSVWDRGLGFWRVRRWPSWQPSRWLGFPLSPKLLALYLAAKYVAKNLDRRLPGADASNRLYPSAVFCGPLYTWFRESDPSWGVDTLLGSRRSIHFDVQGFSRTYWLAFQRSDFFLDLPFYFVKLCLDFVPCAGFHIFSSTWYIPDGGFPSVH
jgi:hypothetical protein